jgi:predicted amidohydrolase
MPIKVAVCQVPEIRQDMEACVGWIEKFAEQAEKELASLVCLPECFLQGYLTNEIPARKHALNLGSPAFGLILQQLAKYRPAIVFGMIEEEAGYLYNTAVVIQQGKLIGRYRKTHLLDGESCFTAGSEYPTFEVSGLKFGINICYDTQFAEAGTAVAAQGASLILCPANNMMRYETAERYKNLHHSIRIQRAVENRVWLLSSDVTGEKDGRISYGPTSAICPEGIVVAQVPLMTTGMIVVEVRPTVHHSAPSTTAVDSNIAACF